MAAPGTWIKVGDSFEYEPENEYAYGPKKNSEYQPTRAMRRAAWRAERGSVRRNALNRLYGLISIAKGKLDAADIKGHRAAEWERDARNRRLELVKKLEGVKPSDLEESDLAYICLMLSL